MVLDIRSIIVIVLGIFIFTFIASFFIEDEIIDTCPDVEIYKNYSVVNYRFGKNNIENYFVLVDSQCEIVYDYYYFEEYFVNKYATIVNKTPENALKTTEDIFEITTKLLNDPLPVPKTKLQEELIKKLKKPVKPIESLNLIITDYSNLYDSSKSGIDDNILTELELESVKSNTTLFVYDVLDKSGFLDEKQILDLVQEESAWYKDVLFWTISFFQSTNTYKNFKKSYYRKALNKIMFEEPMDYLYDNMKTKTSK